MRMTLGCTRQGQLAAAGKTGRSVLDAVDLAHFATGFRAGQLLHVTMEAL